MSISRRGGDFPRPLAFFAGVPPKFTYTTIMNRLLLILFLSNPLAPLFAQTRVAEFETEIRKTISLSGMEQQSQQLIAEALPMLKSAYTNVPPEVWKRYETKLSSASTVAAMIPIYAKYYSLDDIKTINAFLETPAAKRMLAVQDAVMTECIQTGKQLGEKAMKEAIDEVVSERSTRGDQDKLSTVATPTGDVTTTRRLTVEERYQKVIDAGLDPTKYTYIEDNPSIQQPKVPSVPTAATYSIRVKDVGTFYSASEPKKKDGMIRFVDLRRNREMQVSAESIVITKLK
jgi:uncharacterized protein